MTGRTHDVAAITALGIVIVMIPLRQITLATLLLSILANQIGGIAPDIDQPTAPLWRNLPIGGPIGKVFDKLLGGHRFLTHSLLGLGLFGGFAYWIIGILRPAAPHVSWMLIWWSFIIGMISHLVMDSFTKEGVPWLLPIPVKFGLPPLRSMRITTGSIAETLIIFPGLIVLDAWFCTTHYSYILTLLHHYIV